MMIIPIFVYMVKWLFLFCQGLFSFGFTKALSLGGLFLSVVCSISSKFWWLSKIKLDSGSHLLKVSFDRVD